LHYLLDIYRSNGSQTYLNESEILINYIIDTFWNNTINLFITKVNRTGGEVLNIAYTSENALMITYLLELYSLTRNQTYVDYINQTFISMNNQ